MVVRHGLLVKKYKLQTAEMQFLQTVKHCARRGCIRNGDICKELNMKLLLPTTVNVDKVHPCRVNGRLKNPETNNGLSPKRQIYKQALRATDIRTGILA